MLKSPLSPKVQLARTAKDDEPEAGPSHIGNIDHATDNHNDDGEDKREGEDSGDSGDEDEIIDDLVGGMDPEGFSGPSVQVVKPLTKEALAAFKAAQDGAGVIYISRIPPGMRPTKVRHLMSAYGEIGKVYLQQEGTCFVPLAPGVAKFPHRRKASISTTKVHHHEESTLH